MLLTFDAFKNDFLDSISEYLEQPIGMLEGSNDQNTERDHVGIWVVLYLP